MPSQIIKFYRTAAKSTERAIEVFIECEMADGNDYIVEGLHIEPTAAYRLFKKYGKSIIKVIFLIKRDANRFVDGIKKSTTPNDWILNRAKDKRTYLKIAKMICEYGGQIEKETKRLKLKVLNTDRDFDQKLRKAIVYLKK